MNAISKSMPTVDVLMLPADAEMIRPEYVVDEAEQTQVMLKKDMPTSINIHTSHIRDRTEFESAVNKIRPDIIHFTGHGSPTGRATLPSGLPANSLARQFNAMDFHPYCVVFNCCSPDWKASRYKTLARRVVRVSRRFETDDSAILFSGIFYSHISNSIDAREAIDTAPQRFYETSLDDQIKTIKGREDDIRFSTRVFPDTDTVENMGVPTVPTTIDDWGHAAGSKLPDPVPKQKYLSQETIPHRPCLRTVWYATNRKQSKGNKLYYSGERDTQLHYGTCKVSIPKYQLMGKVKPSFWDRLKFWEDNTYRIVDCAAIKHDAYWRLLRNELMSLDDTDKCILLFIHGFNTTFNEAILRAAQIGADLNISGVTAVFSWPSLGRPDPMSYVADGESAQAAEHLLHNYLCELCDRSGAETIHIIAHSMGNRLLLNTAKDIRQSLSASLRSLFKQLFLAAPDVDTEYFKQKACNYNSISLRTTLYVSESDKALRSSGIINRYPRAGYAPPVTRVVGIDTVEVSGIDLTFLGHGYISSARPVLNDMHTLMDYNQDPVDRFGLETIGSDPPPWWRIRK